MDEDFLKEILSDLDGRGLLRTRRMVEPGQGPRVKVNGKEVLNFCSNDYLGLADTDELVAAAGRCLEEEGFGAGASRLVCGDRPAHRALEERIARFKGTPDALLFSTGYMANVGIISSLFGREDLIFSDRLNHASIYDGIVLSRARCQRYPHNDMVALERLLKAAPASGKKVIITDSVFSMDGDMAPLADITALAERYGCLVMIDEAHAFGVLGAKGRGLAEHLGVEDKIDIQMGTLSKAAGSFGAYVAGSEALVSVLMNTARSFIYTTGMPPAVAAASAKALDIIETQPGRRTILKENADYVRAALQEAGIRTLGTGTPIIPLLVNDAALAVNLSQRLFDEGIFISAIRPPAVPPGTARLRLTVTAAHTKTEIDFLIQTIQKVGKELCLI